MRGEEGDRREIWGDVRRAHTEGDALLLDDLPVEAYCEQEGARTLKRVREDMSAVAQVMRGLLDREE